MHQIMVASLVQGLNQVPCRQPRFMLQRGIGGTVVKVTRGPQVGVIGGTAAGCVTSADGGKGTLDRVPWAAATYVPCGQITPSPRVQSRWVLAWYTMLAPMWTGVPVSATRVGAW